MQLTASHVPHWILLVAAACLAVFLAGCGAPASIPVTGSNEAAEGKVRVVEYALVEQSTDNPTHAEFQDRVPPAVNARLNDWTRPASEETLEEPNKVLNPLGFHLSTNPAPPFGAFALYQDGQLLQDGILHLGPVTSQPDGSDFSLPFETIDGKMMVATRSGLSSWSNGEETDTSSEKLKAAPQPGETRLASAASGVVGLQASGVNLAGPETEDNAEYDTIFGEQSLAGQPFFFFIKDGLSGIHYNGEPMGFSYDEIVHDASGVAAIFNPGGNDHIVWFYALRDGLWYYVEVGEDR